MNDDMLSQEEINALLEGMDNDDTSTDETSSELVIENYLSGIEQDAMGEIGNISFGSAATALSTLLNQKVDITTPRVSVVKYDDLDQEFPQPHVAVSVQYTEGFTGKNLLVIKSKDAAVIADLMLGNDGTNVNEELTEMEISAVQEAMNQMMGSASTSMSTIFNKRVDISPPDIDLLNLREDPDNVDLPEDDILVQISFDLKISNLIDSKIMQLVTVPFAKAMVEQLMNPDGDDQQSSVEAHESQADNVQPPESASNVTNEVNQLNVQEPSNEPLYEEQQHVTEKNERNEAQYLSSGPKQPERSASVQPAAFTNFEEPSLSETESKNLDMLLDIPLDVTVELGRTKRSIKDILELSQGSIIELDKLAGEPVDILVNKKLIANGEVVVIDENFGVRVTNIVSPRDRLNKLK
ncbi:flagellar motor switch phosphatase FliY [Bacillus shivajii]|uniref:flagellar motor switch phosphatase FliY n=1 Tax=Bacillus shivajii TaxID=1983719 RepID=UPI001CFA91A9|nr:flagellar motor switch phosphatase FliY [Bacillus shivajii]UCZ51716.1 flagellar motor switch phosphatase FliY [Bacillus shivajii]